MKFSELIINRFIPYVVFLMGAKAGSWKEKKYTTVLQSIIMIPIKRFRGVRRISSSVEKQYDDISGLYIKDNYYAGRERYSVVNGEINWISSIDNMRLIRSETNEVLSKIEFKSVSYISGNSKKDLGIECFNIESGEIVKIFKKINFIVEQIDRVTYGSLTKKDLTRGKWRHLTMKERGFLQMH